MRLAIQKYSRDSVAIVLLVLLAAAVGGYILAQQRLHLPGWVPFFGRDFYTLKADFSTAQAVTPGQGQTVDIAGVGVGEITKVELVGGHAVVTMKIKPKYAQIYPDATMLLRPKTGLKDMTVELNPGSSKAGPKLPDGAAVPVSATQPDINLDEILKGLDADSRDYLRLLLAGAGRGLKGNGRQLAQAFRRLNPTGRDLDRIASKVAERRTNLRRLVHNFQLLAAALGGKDRQLAELVGSSDRLFRDLAAQDANLRATIALLPGTLGATRKNLTKVDRLARTLGPTLQHLRPAVRALGPALRQTRPFLRATTPIIRNQIRPFTRVAQPTIRILRPAARDLADLTPRLTRSTSVVNYLLNELAYNPPGNGVGKEGYLFWVSWANHDANSVFATQDAHGPIRRGLFLVSCSTLGTIFQLTQVNPELRTVFDLLGAPDRSICPNPSGPSGGAAARGKR